MNAEPKLSGGVLIHLPRDQAKSFFGLKADDAVLEFVTQSLDSGVTLNTDSAWSRLAAALGDEPPMVWTFTGGRPMFHGDSHQVLLIRPDMVGHIATSMTEMSDDALTELALSLIHI